jgi:hypothetical protein
MMKASWGTDLHRPMSWKQVDIGDGDRPRPTFISAKLDPVCKQLLVDLLKGFKDSFAWEY